MQMNRPDPFNQTEGLGDGIIDVLGGGRVNKRYDLWNRNPMSVTAKYLDSNGQEDLPLKTTLPSY